MAVVTKIALKPLLTKLDKAILQRYMVKFKFFFIGKIPSKANYKRISHRRINGELKPFIVNRSSVTESQNNAVYQFHIQKQRYGLENFPISKPIRVSFSFWLSQRVRQRDIDNAEKFVGDALEKAKVIKKDSLIYSKESVEKRLGLRHFYEIITIRIEPLSEEVVKKSEEEIKTISEDLIDYMKILRIEIPKL